MGNGTCYVDECRESPLVVALCAWPRVQVPAKAGRVQQADRLEWFLQAEFGLFIH